MSLKFSDPDKQHVVQIAYHVADLDTAVARWHAATGIGPFFLRRQIPLADVYYRGAPSSLEIGAAMAQFGNMQLELIQQLCDKPSTFREMFGMSDEGMHHVAVAPRDEAAMLAHYEKLGCPVVTGFNTMAGGGADYVDTRPLFGHMLELYRVSDRIIELYGRVAAAAKDWDGRQLVIELS